MESDTCQKSIRSPLIIICQKCNSQGINLAWVPFCCGCLWVSVFRKGSIWWVPLGKEFYGKEFYGSTTYKIIRGTDLVVFVLIFFPQMSNILLLKSVPLTHPQISNKIMWLYYPYVVLQYVPSRYILFFHPSLFRPSLLR